MPRLISPDIRYKDAFLEAYDDFAKDELWTEIDRTFLQNRFEDYVNELIGFSKGRGLPLGYVPATSYWIINGDKVAGQISLRHYLNDSLKKFGGHVGYEIRPSERKKGLASFALKEMLSIAKNKGLKKLLITCDESNLASQKVIEKNGGLLQDKIQNEGREELTRRYWITI